MNIRRYCPRCGARPIGRCACRTRGVSPAVPAAAPASELPTFADALAIIEDTPDRSPASSSSEASGDAGDSTTSGDA